MSDSLIDSLSGLSREDIVAALAINLLECISLVNETLGDLLLILVIPHKFDVVLLDELIDEYNLGLDLDKVVEEIDAFSFISQYDSGEFVFHEDVRKSFLILWQDSKRISDYVKHSRFFFNYYQNIQELHEALYHQFVVDTDSAFEQFQIDIYSTRA